VPCLVDVVIVNYNSGRNLPACLESLGPELAGYTSHVVVVDNGSTDGSERVARTDGDVLLVRAERNLGFARGANLGARQCAAPYLLFVNPDARLLPGALGPLVADLEANPRCGAVAPSVVNEDGSAQGNARGDPSPLTGLFGRSGLIRRLVPNAAVSRRNVIEAAVVSPGACGIEVDWIAGSCMLCRRQAFEATGGFDERYFLYWEDADLCRRLRNEGWVVRFRPDARVVHIGGASSRHARARATCEFHRSAYRYYATHEVPSPWHPLRWAAGALLFTRCAISLGLTALSALTGRDPKLSP
jgi:GT2 family glycosyltransferase